MPYEEIDFAFGTEPDILVCSEPLLEETLRLAFHTLGPEERDIRVQGLLELYAQGKLALDGIFCVQRNTMLLGAMFSQARDEKTVLIWPPGIVSEEEPRVRTLLYERMNRHLEQIGAEIAIVFVENGESLADVDLENIGFRYLSDLLYLVAEETVFPMEPGRTSLAFVPLACAKSPEPGEIDIPDEAFREMTELVGRTYEGTRDFPELCGVVPTEEILRGYQFEGVFRPELWFGVRHEGKSIGSLILTDQPDMQHLELTYMGIVPEERGKRYAQAIVQYALYTARRLNRRLLIVSVDAQNEAALRAYLRSGFQVWDKKRLFVRFFKTESDRVGGQEPDSPLQ